MKLKDAIKEVSERFGKLEVNGMQEIIPKYEKELQKFLNANKAGKLYGISSMGGLDKNQLSIIGERAIVTIDMNTMKPISVSVLWK